uniref:dynamin GTPase n=1 Tax=Plectus sambesii TaxID=2011161 RepID=A0A914WNB9_9BILA
MEGLIPVVNELQDALASVDGGLALDLPQIAVVGSQSAGKSSVLENIVGRDFLPRGSGIVTRRPLLLQLVRNTDTVEEYGEFLHRRGEIFADFEEIRKEIQAETDRSVGSGKNVSAQPIHLRLIGPKYMDLTLVDLPGLTKVPVGDQPADIELQVRNMILTYIERPTCLILAVCPANADLATSDALQLAQRVDADGLRTIGVLTKIDLMDGGTNARDILENRLIPLTYGYVGIVNRSQRDIDGKKNVQSALEAELNFFRNHDSYKDLDRVGTPCLIARLNEQLTLHIAEVLPDFKVKVQRQIQNLERQLNKMVLDYPHDDPQWKPKALIVLTIKFSQLYKIEMIGMTDAGLNLSRYSYGAKIMNIFHRNFKSLLAATEFTHEDKMKREIGITITNIWGVRPGLFPPDKAFDRVIRSQIKKLEQPMLWVVDAVSQEMLKALQYTIDQAASQFPLLAQELRSRCDGAISKYAHIATDRVKELLEYELAYINTKHEDFVGFSYAEQKGYSRVLKRRHPGMEVTQKGWLIMNKKRFWFVLTPNALCWYADETENERQYMVPIDDSLLFREAKSSNRFIIASQSGNIHFDKSEIELQTTTLEELDRWKRSLLQVGIFTGGERLNLNVENMTISEEIFDEHDPWLERQIESIWILTDSYMRIVCRTLVDVVPKCVVRTLIKDTIEYFEKTLIAEISRLPNCDDLMEENKSECEKRDRLRTSLEACQKALEKLSRTPLPKVIRKPRTVEHRPLHESLSSGQISKPSTAVAESSAAVSLRPPPRSRTRSASRTSGSEKHSDVVDRKSSSPIPPTDPPQSNGNSNLFVRLFPKSASPFSPRSLNSQRSIRKSVEKSITSENRTQWHVND